MTWKWLVGVMVGILVVGGGGWMNHMQGQVSDIRSKQEAAGKDASTQSADIAVIKEKLRTIEDRQKEAAEQSKDINRKLDELIQRKQR